MYRCCSRGADYRPWSGSGSSKALDDGTASVDLGTAGSVAARRRAHAARTLDLCVCVFMRRWLGFLEPQFLIHAVLQRVHERRV